MEPIHNQFFQKKNGPTFFTVPLRRQADLSYSQGYGDDGEDGKDDSVKEDNDKGGMNDKNNLL